MKGDEAFLKLSAQIGYKHLTDDIALQGADGTYTSLVWPLQGGDPDEAFSGVPYEKVYRENIDTNSAPTTRFFRCL